MSLSKLVIQKQKEQAPLIPEVKEVKDEFPDLDDLEIEAPDTFQQSKKHVCFVSDTPLTHTLKNELSQYDRVVSFDPTLFSNRSWIDIENIPYLWINIQDDDARKWLSKNIRKIPASQYELIIIYSSNIKSKWIENLKPYSKAIMKAKHLDDLKTLNQSDILESLDYEKIVRPATGLAKILVNLCTGKKKAKK